jgi:nucleotide-binding universal stress UspA family protein
MLAFRTILHPTDFSPAAEFAFQLAGSLARDHGAELILLHVNPPKAADEIAVEVQKEMLWEEFHRLERTDPHVRNLRIRTEFVEGDPGREILRVARETGADLIVMGTHGRTGLTRLLTGSVAEHVLRKAPCPVLTVKTAVPKKKAAPAVPAEEPAEV